jgi:hypothetical protein
LVDFHEIWYGGNAIQGDLAAIIFNHRSSTIMKWLVSKVVSWRHDFQPCIAMLCDCLVVGLLWLHHVQSLDNVNMATTAIGKVSKLVLPRTSCQEKLNSITPTQLVPSSTLKRMFYHGQKIQLLSTSA